MLNHNTSPLAHLLRTFASVPIENRILDLACGWGRHTVPLAQLGFDVYACDAYDLNLQACRTRLADLIPQADLARRITKANPDALGYPDEYFDWIVAFRTSDGVGSEEALLAIFQEAHRVQKTGGWMYTATPAAAEEKAEEGLHFTPVQLLMLLNEAGWVSAGRPSILQDGETELVVHIVRKVDDETPE